MGSFTIEIVNLLWAVGGIAGGYLATRIASGAPPVVDPDNKRPVIDLFRDIVREVIAERFGGPSVPPANKP